MNAANFTRIFLKLNINEILKAAQIIIINNDKIYFSLGIVLCLFSNL